MQQPDEPEPAKTSVLSTYKVIVNILKLVPVKKLGFLLLTIKVGLITSSVVFLKLIENGVKKEVQTLFGIPLAILSIIWALLVSNHVNKKKPLVLFFDLVPLKLVASAVVCIFIYFIPKFLDAKQEFVWYFYLVFFILFGLNTVVDTTCFLAAAAFFARISDEKFGGTYMTLLTALNNLGILSSSTAGLYLTNWFTFKKCKLDHTMFNSNSTLSAFNQTLLAEGASCTIDKECSNNASCTTTLDPFYILSVIFFTVGLIYYLVFRKLVKNLNNLPKSAWKLN